VPLLILHGGADPQVSPRQALRLALRLDERAHPYELHILAGGSHTLAEQAVVRDSLVIAWFRKNDR
jgi:dipeptidyl aminopeptidase/acylaminoacyl peptidase